MKVMVDIEHGYLKGFPKQVPEHLVTEDGKWKDWDKVRAWIVEQNDGQEFECLRMWYKGDM